MKPWTYAPCLLFSLFLCFSLSHSVSLSLRHMYTHARTLACTDAILTVEMVLPLPVRLCTEVAGVLLITKCL